MLKSFDTKPLSIDTLLLPPILLFQVHVSSRLVGRLNLTSLANGTQKKDTQKLQKFHQRGCTQNVFLNFRKLFPECLPFHSISDRKSRNVWSNGKRSEALTEALLVRAFISVFGFGKKFIVVLGDILRAFGFY